MSLKLDEHQHQAINNLSASNGLSVLCGSAGRGKSTIVDMLLERLIDHGADPKLIRICAPTGKACAVVNDMITAKLPSEAMTIHRMLGCQGPTWLHDSSNRLKAEWLIVEESSMVSSLMLARIINSVSEGCNIILSGDHKQLFPIDAGAPFLDIIKANRPGQVSKLITNYRQKNGELLADACERILDGTLPNFGEPGKDTLGQGTEDNVFFHAEEDKALIPPKTLAIVRAWYDNKDDHMVLIPQRTGDCGINSMNEYLQEQLNPHQPGVEEIKIYQWYLRPGDRVKQTKNDYSLDVMNGFVGNVVGVAGGCAVIDFNGEIKEYTTKEQLNNLALAYAVSIHSSQGSQYSKGVLVMHSSHYYMMSRQLLYVGVSRFRDELHVIGNKKALNRAIRNTTENSRQTFLGLSLNKDKKKLANH